MPSEQALVIALRAAVEAAPDLEVVRLQLAEALLRAGEAEEALLHARTVLGRRPDSEEALELGVSAAGACGEDELAESFGRLLQALRGGAPAERVPADDREVPEDAVIGEVSGPTVRLADVGGMEDAKRRLELAFLGPMRNPELRELYGAELRGGLLLWGPPGCGKTLLARAVAGELGASFISVGLEDVLDMWLGQSEKRLHELFAQARRLAPCVLFFDEIDALGQKRGQLRNSAGRNIVNQLLSEMDGLRYGGADDGVFILGATNHPWDIDAALRRPGRFDRAVLVLPPDRPARAAILGMHLRERPTEGLDLDDIAKRSAGFSGADLALVCRSAAAAVMAEAVDTGRSRPIAQGDLRAALEDGAASTGAWFKLAYNYAAFSGEQGYEDLLAHIKRHRLA